MGRLINKTGIFEYSTVEDSAKETSGPHYRVSQYGILDLPALYISHKVHARRFVSFRVSCRVVYKNARTDLSGDMAVYRTLSASYCYFLSLAHSALGSLRLSPLHVENHKFEAKLRRETLLQSLVQSPFQVYRPPVVSSSNISTLQIQSAPI